MTDPRSSRDIDPYQLRDGAGPGISPVAEVNSHITGTSYNTQIAIWIFNASDPRSIAVATLQVAIDQGSADPRCVGPAYRVRPIGMITHQGSEPALKQIFGQGLPKLHPFGLSPLIPGPISRSRHLETYSVASDWTRDQSVASRPRAGPIILVGSMGSSQSPIDTFANYNISAS